MHHPPTHPPKVRTGDAPSTPRTQLLTTSPGKQKTVQFSKSTEARAHTQGCGLPKSKKTVMKMNVLPTTTVNHNPNPNPTPNPNPSPNPSPNPNPNPNPNPVQCVSPSTPKSRHVSAIQRSPGGSSPFRGGATSRLGRLTEASFRKDQDSASRSARGQKPGGCSWNSPDKNHKEGERNASESPMKSQSAASIEKVAVNVSSVPEVLIPPHHLPVRRMLPIPFMFGIHPHPHCRIQA
jgi:hypothetical protein